MILFEVNVDAIFSDFIGALSQLHEVVHGKPIEQLPETSI